MIKGISSSFYERSVIVSKGDNFNKSEIQETLDNIKTGVNRRLNARQKQKARAER